MSVIKEVKLANLKLWKNLFIHLEICTVHGVDQGDH